MKGSPRSIMLTWANRAAGWWTSAAVNAAQQQQRVALKALTPKRPKPARKRKRTKS